MCGITGILGSQNYKSEIKTMSNLLIHRGPDFNSTYSDNNIALGHTRLAILDLTDHSNQPFISTCGNYVLVFNGEIYNHKQIRAKYLNKEEFITNSDTETLMKSLIHVGKNIIKELNGIFAFAFYNIKDKKLLIARDRFGVKPLYYYKKDNVFAFSSEIKSLKEITTFDKQVNEKSMEEYIKFHWTFNNSTIYKYINKVPPGNYFDCDIEKIKQIEFVKYEVEEKNNLKIGVNFNEVTKKVDELLNNAVKSQLQSDVPISFLLSGGLDSSLLVAIAKKYTKEKLECFTYFEKNVLNKHGFSSDFSYAQKVANYLNVNLNYQPVEIDEVSLKKINDIVEEPIADPASIYLQSIAKLIHSNGFKVVISGTGADEVFGGYRRHQMVNRYDFYNRIGWNPYQLISWLFVNIRGNTPFKRRLKKYIISMGSANEYIFIENLMSHISSTLINKTSSNRISYESKIKEMVEEGASSTTLLSKCLLIDKKSYLVNNNLLYLDKICMSNSIEARVPYLDADLVHFVNNLPNKWILKNNIPKALLKNVAKKYLPNEVIHREKTGFGLPANEVIKSVNIKEELDAIKLSSIDTAYLLSRSKDEYFRDIELSQLLLSIIAMNSILAD